MLGFCVPCSLLCLAQTKISASWHRRTLFSTSSDDEARSRTARQHTCRRAAMPYPTLPCHCKRVQRLESMRYDSQSSLRQPELFVRFSHCHPNAFPSSSLAYIANLALLTTTINRRLVPCPNAVRHHQEPACSGTSDLAPAVLHVQPAASPATVALPARQKKNLSAALARVLCAALILRYHASHLRASLFRKAPDRPPFASGEQLSPHPSSLLPKSRQWPFGTGFRPGKRSIARHPRRS